MARGDRVAEVEHVVRYAKPTSFAEGILTHVAFERRPGADDDGVSVCRLGLLRDDPIEDLNQLRELIHCRRAMKRSGKLAELSVAAIEAASREVKQALFVQEDPDEATDRCPENPAHAVIIGLPFAGTEDGELSAVAAGDVLARKVCALHDPSPGLPVVIA